MDFNPANQQLLRWYGKGYHFLNETMLLGMIQTQVQNENCLPALHAAVRVEVWHSTSMGSTVTSRPRVCILWRGGVSCPVSAAWHSCVAAHWSKYHYYKQAPSWYDLRCLNKQTRRNCHNELAIRISRFHILLMINMRYKFG